MKRRVGLAGFTIVETMIVLAVTGALFIAVAGTLAGRQRSNEFTQSINDARDQIQQVITETQNGYYASGQNFDCSLLGGGISLAVGSNHQGTNGDCVFLGKVIQFKIKATNPEEARVYPIAGIRTATDLTTAHPTPVITGTIDASTAIKLKYGLTTVKMTSGGVPIGAFGVLSSLDSSNPGKSGDQQFSVYGIKNTNVLGNDDKNQAALKIKNSLASTSGYDVNPTGGIKICFESGGTPQYGLITIGDNGGQLAIDLKIIDKAGLAKPCNI